MSYLVLARKWRPQTFDDVVGQAHITRTLANAIRQNRVAHAFVFTGSRGVGKTSTARILAKALNCKSGPTAEPCNTCTACTEITDGRAVDIIEIDGASNRGINEIREIREAVRYAPSRDRYKVYIIDEVHMLTTEAFNALLKTLEEPPPHAVFVFATTEPAKIPVTILSRCQRYDFKRVQIREIALRLRQIATAEQLSFDDDALALIARHARGGMRDALSAMDQVIAFADGHVTADATAEILGVASRRHLLELGEALVRRDVARALGILDFVDRYGQDLVHFATELLHHLRDMTVVRAIRDAKAVTDLSDGEYEDVRRQVEGVELSQLQRMFQLCAEAVEQISRSQFPKLLVEMTLVKLSAVEPLMPLAPLLSRLEALDRTLSSDAAVDGGTMDRYRELLGESAQRWAAVATRAPAPDAARPLASGRAPAVAARSVDEGDADDSEPEPSPSRSSLEADSAGRGQRVAYLQTAPPEVLAPASDSPPQQGGEWPDDGPSDETGELVNRAVAPPEPASDAAMPRPQEAELAQVGNAAVGQHTAEPLDDDDDEEVEGPGASVDHEQATWRVLLAAMAPAQGKVLAHARLRQLNAQLIEFWLPDRYLSFFAAEDQARLLDAAERVLGARPRLSVLRGGTPESERASVADEQLAAHRKTLEQRRQRIANDPVFKAAVERFVPDHVSIDIVSPEEEPVP